MEADRAAFDLQVTIDPTAGGAGPAGTATLLVDGEFVATRAVTSTAGQGAVSFEFESESLELGAHTAVVVYDGDGQTLWGPETHPSSVCRAFGARNVSVNSASALPGR